MKHPVILIAIIPIIALCIAVIHKRPEWYQTRSDARWERQAQRRLNQRAYNDILFRGNIAH